MDEPGHPQREDFLSPAEKRLGPSVFSYLEDSGDTKIPALPAPKPAVPMPTSDEFPPPAASPRLHSLDAMRGLDMLVIMGLDELIHALDKLIHAPWMQTLAEQTSHVSWEGLHAYDLIFPLFVFMMGVSLAYSRGGPAMRGTRKILARALLLVVLGFIYNGALDFHFAEQRWPSVLGLIGIAYGISGVICAKVSNGWGRLAWLLGISGGVAALQLWVPVPGGTAGALTPDGIINGWIDRRVLPGTLYGGVFDPEGILCCLSASVLGIGGCLMGTWIKSRGIRITNVLVLAVLGAACMAGGWYVWKHLGYLSIKSAWTSSFNMLALGIGLSVFALFHLLVDFVPWRWSRPLEWIGMNALAAYLLNRIVPFGTISEFFLGGVARLAGEAGPVVLAAGALALAWLVMWFLWKKRAFFRV